MSNMRLGGSTDFVVQWPDKMSDGGRNRVRGRHSTAGEAIRERQSVTVVEQSESAHHLIQDSPLRLREKADESVQEAG